MKNCIFLLSFMIYCLSSFAQKRTEPFHINLPEQKISGSVYNTIGLLDAREDTASLGFVQLGAFNTKAMIVFKQPFPGQLSAVLQALVDSTAGSDELFFQLRKFSFAEVTSSFSEKGYFYLRAALYTKVNDRFYRISTIDTLILVKSSLDVTKTLLRNAGTVISDFIGSNLRRRPSDSAFYSSAEIERPDSAEKSRIKLYTTAQYTNGLYKNSLSFFNQTPDAEVKVQEKKGEIKRVQVVDSTGKWIKASPKEAYAFVHNGNPYMVTHYGYYRLNKNGDDFYFTGKAKVTADPMSQVAAGMMFGLVGSLLASSATSNFLMKLDHGNGSFIMIREIPETVSGSN